MDKRCGEQLSLFQVDEKKGGLKVLVLAGPRTCMCVTWLKKNRCCEVGKHWKHLDFMSVHLKLKSKLVRQ